MLPNDPGYRSEIRETYTIKFVKFIMMKAFPANITNIHLANCISQSLFVNMNSYIYSVFV